MAVRTTPRWPLAWPIDAAATAHRHPRAVVLDTNIVLDLLVFADAAVPPLRTLLAQGQLRWIATRPMRDELERVLAYPQIAPRVAYYGLTAEAVLACYDAQVEWVDVAPRVSAVCKDADDQRFIDLAVAHRAVLLSKDKAVLCMRKRLLALQVHAATAIVISAEPSPSKTLAAAAAVAEAA